MNSSSYILNSRRDDAWTEYDLKSVDKSRERLRLYAHFFLVRRRTRRQRRRARRGEDELEKHHPTIQNIIDEKEREKERIRDAYSTHRAYHHHAVSSICVRAQHLKYQNSKLKYESFDLQKKGHILPLESRH